MKKFIFIFLILFIITGCEATYTIDIDSDFNENLVVVPNGSEELQNMINYKYVHPAYYDEENYEMDDYDSTSDPYSDDSFFEDLSDNEVFTQAPIKRYNKLMTDRLYYSYTFKDEYQDSFIANYSSGIFSSITSSNSNSYSSISASDFAFIFEEYPALDRITINIKTTKNVISNDADKVSGNTYTWIVSKNNPGRRINITYTDDRYYTQTETNYDFDEFNSSILNILNSNINPDTDDTSDLEEGESKIVNPNNGGGTINPDNSNNDSSSNKTNNNKSSNVVLYVLYTLFFGLIFGIIILRTFKNNIKIKK